MSASSDGQRKSDRWYLVLALVCAFAPLLARLYLLLPPTPLNVDEAQWTVSARRIFDDFIVWRANDLTTSGPLNAVVIAWPQLLGLVPSLFTSRLTGLILQSGALFGLARLIPRGALVSPSTAAALLTVTLLATTADPEFNHYSSEILSLALIVAFCALFAGVPPGRRSAWRYFFCGLLATSLVFAKLQSATFCVLFHGVCLLSLAMDARRGPFPWRAGLAYGLGALLPILILVVPLFLVGEQDAVLVGYFGLGSGYGGTRTFTILRKLKILLWVDAALLAYVLARLRHAALRAQARWEILALSLGLWPVVLFTIIWPGRTYSHYLLYGFIALPLSVVLAERVLPGASTITKRGVLFAALTAALLAAIVTLRLPVVYRAMLETGREFAFARSGDARPLFAWAGVGPGDSALMWGWEPQLLAYAGVKSADRASHSEYLIRPNKGRDYFRARLLKDLGGAVPALVFDTVRDGYFFANDPDFTPSKSDLRSFPELFEKVGASSAEITRRPECAAVYLRRDKWERLRNREVPLQSSAPALVDGSITERCDDWWAPGKPGATATLRLESPTTLGAIWLLASRGGEAQNLGTAHVRLRLLGPDAPVREQIVHLFDYPQWTVAAAPPGLRVSAIEIELLDQIGDGPALNEVKAFRAASEADDRGAPDGATTPDTGAAPRSTGG